MPNAIKSRCFESFQITQPMMWRCGISGFGISVATVSFRFRNLESLVLALVVLLALTGLQAQTTPLAIPKTEDVQSQYQAGLSLVRSGHIDEAISTFKKALEIAPSDKVLLDATGAAYSLEGDLANAQSYFVESMKVDPNFLPAKQNLGITLYSLGRYPEAEEQFRSIQSQSERPNAVTNLFLGMISEKRGDCKGAVPLMENAGTLVYKFPDALLSLAYCHYQLGNPQRAVKTLIAFDQSSTKSALQYERAADLYARLGQNHRALADLSRAQSGKRKGQAFEIKRAALLEKAGRLEEAQKLLEEVAASKPSGDVLLDLARVAKARGDFAVAMKSLQRASQIEPEREESYLEFSTICADHGNDSLALETADIGLSHVPDSYRLTVQKGVVLEKLGHLNEAESYLRTAIGLQKDNSIALLSLAVVLAHSGRADEAEQTLARAIQQFPDNYYMYYFQAKLLLQFSGNVPGRADLRESARRSLEQSIRLNPEYADSYYQLSDIYLATDPKLAERALQKCLKLDPNHIPAQYSLARLYIRTGRKAEGQALLARFKTQQRSEELQQQKQLRIDVAPD